VKGLEVLRLIHPESSPTELAMQADSIVGDFSTRTDSSGFWSRQLKTPILLAILIAVFNQLSGINAILYFAPRIFELTGLAAKAALLQSVGIGVTNLVFTLVGLWLIDRLGRRTLLFIGSFGYILALSLVSWAFFTKHYGIVPICIFAFIAAHAIGQGAVIWVFISEIFPNKFRAEGQSLGCFTHWFFAALITTFFPKIVTSFLPGWVFLFFCSMMVLQLVWVKFMVPETKGVPLEDMADRLKWGRQ
jgi:MFS family permease